MSGDYLTKLRQKPKHIRDNIAFGAASGFTALIAVFLIFAVHGPKVVDSVAREDDSPQFFETLVNQAKEQMASVRSAASSTEAENTKIQPTTPAANGSGAPAPALLQASSSIEVASSSMRTVLIATTSSSTDGNR
jgi:hypothetical protein